MSPSPMPTYAVTGASGRLGNVLIRQLLARGDSVRALVMPNDPQAASLEGLAITKVTSIAWSRARMGSFISPR
jgi:uncharacterized protein YbjT (DUF2867 family)